MDTEKLLRILIDLQSDEDSLSIEAQLSGIKQTLASNTSDGYNAARTQLRELTDRIQESSISYNFSRTENHILEHLNGEKYFGLGLVTSLRQIFATGGFDTQARFDKFISSRADFLRAVQRLSTAFGDMGIDDYRPEQGEIGVVLPHEEGDLETFTKRIKELKLLLSGLAQAAGQPPTEVKITRMSNGTLEIFSLQTAEVICLFSTLLVNVSLIWDKIAQFKSKIDETEKSDILSKDAKRDINQVLEKEAERIKEEILNELPERMLKELKSASDGQRNVIANHIRVCINIAFGWLEAGVEVDITPTRLSSPDPMTKKEAAGVSIANEANSKLRHIYSQPIGSRKLPFKLPAPQNPPAPKAPTKKAAKQSKEKRPSS